MDFKTWFKSEWQKIPHQKVMPFMRDPEAGPFYRYAAPFLGSDVQDFNLRDSQYEPGKLYHVATNLSAVLAAGRLKSRAELGGAGIGLGGGPSNMAPSLVSLTYNYGKALEIYEGLQFVAGVVSGQVAASAVYDYAMDYSDDRFYDSEDELSQTDNTLIDYGVPKKVVRDGDDDKIKAVLDRRLRTAQARYEFLQEMERAVIADNPRDDYSDYMQFDPVVGFTAPFEAIRGLITKNIAIVQVVIRRDAEVSHYAQEAEIRARPQDVAIVRYLRP